jgi:hypothetical protein
MKVDFFLVLSEKRKKKEKSSRDWQAQMSSLTEGGDEKQVVFLFPTKTKNSSLGILFLRTKYLYLYLIVLVREVEENTSIKISFWLRTVGIT